MNENVYVQRLPSPLRTKLFQLRDQTNVPACRNTKDRARPADLSGGRPPTDRPLTARRRRLGTSVSDDTRGEVTAMMTKPIRILTHARADIQRLVSHLVLLLCRASIADIIHLSKRLYLPFVALLSRIA